MVITYQPGFVLGCFYLRFDFFEVLERDWFEWAALGTAGIVARGACRIVRPVPWLRHVDVALGAAGWIGAGVEGGHGEHQLTFRGHQPGWHTYGDVKPRAIM